MNSTMMHCALIHGCTDPFTTHQSPLLPELDQLIGACSPERSTPEESSNGFTGSALLQRSDLHSNRPTDTFLHRNPPNADEHQGNETLRLHRQLQKGRRGARLTPTSLCEQLVVGRNRSGSEDTMNGRLRFEGSVSASQSRTQAHDSPMINTRAHLHNEIISAGERRQAGDRGCGRRISR